MTFEPPDFASSGRPVRRRLTLLYADLSRSTALSRLVEAEHYRELLAELRHIWREAAQQHAGRLVLAQGDGALLVFGIDTQAEDDGRRATDAALAIHQAVLRLQPHGVPVSCLPLQMHSGIHSGNLLLSEGDIERGRFDLSGEVLNTTVHLAQQATSGQVLVSLQTLGPNAHFFELTDLPRPVGTPDAVEADFQRDLRAVVGRSTATRRFEATALHGLTPFIGRADVLGALQAWLRGVGADPSRCLVLQGGPGMGKTRLLEELLQQADLAECQLLRGGCENYLGAEVLQPFLQMLRAWVVQTDAVQRPPTGPADPVRARDPTEPTRAADTHTPGLAAAVRALVLPASRASDTPAQANAVTDVLAAFFAALSAQRPCVLVIDDWQWADDASRHLLQLLMRQDKGARVMLATRPRDDGGDWVAGSPHLSVLPFTAQESQAAVQRMLVHPDPFLVARIHAYAGGVPLFEEELCHSALTDRLPQGMDGRSAAHGWIATLVVMRLERLPPEQADVVRAASVVGNQVPMRWLAAACGQAPSPATLQALADADFLRADADTGGQALRFKHGITRDAVYDSISLQARMALHQRVATLLQAESDPARRDDLLEALAHHSRGAGHWAPAALFAEQAGDKAMAAFALDRARAQYLAAMDALDRLPLAAQDTTRRWCQLASKLGMTCIFDTLALPDALALFERAVGMAQRLGDALVLARAHYWLGYMCYGHGQLRAAAVHCREALRLAAEAGDQRLHTQVEATLGQVLTATCSYAEAMPLMARALSSKRGRLHQGSSVAAGSAFTLACQASVLGDQGNFEQANAALAEARHLLGESAHPVANSVRNWEVMVLLWQGRWADALAVADESCRLAERSAALLPMAIARAAGGYARWRADASPEGFEQIAEAVQWMQQRRVRFYTSIYHGWLVQACAARQQLGDARRHAAWLLARARAGEVLGLGDGSRAMALACLDAGRPGLAERHLARADAVAQQRQSRREQALNALCRAEWQQRIDQPAKAGAAARQAADAFAAMGMAWHAQQAAAYL